ncbi:DNA-directed RNA polymerase III subunit RPC4 [Hemiscyllium ocellatum]|uniref:DNA-directed RNA polymerase III subunit RPC4 n=1 Tax=Hemiscyllium ocellatum TaxID=170820 RepID=UPI0029670FCA|nr:DNA-directed RNA polymerase III subunit RPC4 [Hemiscyllium ocellatum]
MSERGPGGDAGHPSAIRPAVTVGRGLPGRRSSATVTPGRLPSATVTPGRLPSATVTPGRLPSIRSRDLTLGGMKKKTFTPNIISRKVKEEPKEDDASQRKEKKERDKDRQRETRGRGRGRPETIQSHSIFEQGPAEMMKKRAGWDSSMDMKEFGTSPIINIKKEKRESEEETKQILRMLDRDDFIDDPGLRNDARNMPVQLPLAQSGRLFKEEVEDEEMKPALLTKEEKMEVDVPSVKIKDEPGVAKEMQMSPNPSATKMIQDVPKELSVSELLQELSLCKDDELLFLQLPDTLPGQAPTRDEKPVKAEVQADDGQTMLLKQEKAQELKQAENSCSLMDLTEGQIGKLLIRKSGRVQLVLGQVTLDVTMGTTCSFLQELVSIGIGENRTGEMTVLGHVKHKLVCSPDFETLLQQRQ